MYRSELWHMKANKMRMLYRTDIHDGGNVWSTAQRQRQKKSKGHDADFE